jgi:undecaprenyl-diphosphatase
MPVFEIFILAAVQGITEFLPVSSSGHLRVASDILGMSENTLVMDVAVHVGTLFAVILYFWRDLVMMVTGLGSAARGRKHEGARLSGFLVVATAPVVIGGFFGQSLIENSLRTVEIVGWTTIGFGMLLFLADRSGMRIRRLEHMNFPNAVIIGLAQVLALIPGTSRSGITITAARFLGYDRIDAARFSMLLSIPAITGAGLLIGSQLLKNENALLTSDFLIASALSFVTALAAIALFFRWLRFSGFGPFVIYRIAIGGLLLSWTYGAF